VSSDKERKFQRQCDAFIDRELVYRASTLFYELGRLPNFTLVDCDWSDEFINLTFPALENCGCDMDEEEKAKALEDEEPLESCGDCQREIFEQWIVTRYFGECLKERGEVVEEFMGLLVWGRTTTGQSVSLDGVVRDIVEWYHQKDEMSGEELARIIHAGE